MTKPLFIFEMANNHMGDTAHGVAIIRAIHEACQDFDFDFAFKLQYRDLDSFIHPSFKGRDDVKYVKRGNPAGHRAIRHPPRGHARLRFQDRVHALR